MGPRLRLEVLSQMTAQLSPRLAAESVSVGWFFYKLLPRLIPMFYFSSTYWQILTCLLRSAKQGENDDFQQGSEKPMTYPPLPPLLQINLKTKMVRQFASTHM